MTRIPFDEMHATVRDAFVNAGMNEHDADACARVHTESSCDGVYSHGLNRVARFVDYVRRGWIDLGGRPYLAYNLKIKQARVGSFDTELVHDFFLALTNQAGMNVHLNLVQGRNAHHIIEAAFKAFARALDQARQRDPRVEGVPSTKGAL